MHWIYLSPHFDDAVLSCGGLIWEQAQRRERVEIWTIFGGDPPPGPLTPFARSLHERWQSGPQAVSARQVEDERAGRRLGASLRRFELPDCIYRCHAGGTAVVQREEDLFQPGYNRERPLVEWIQGRIDALAPQAARLVSPIALGDHIDHQLVWSAAVSRGAQAWFYADYPYVVRHPQSLPDRARSYAGEKTYPLSEAGIAAWQDAVAQYASQLSTFWSSAAEMRQAIQAYARANRGSRLWTGYQGAL
jgi:LmbE family N-acetylglucosaminyl deacetylase